MQNEQAKGLDELLPHQLGVVTAVEADDDDMARLMAMGVCSGRTVEVVQTGDPLILKLFGSRVGVSARLAKRVQVETCGSESCPGGVLGGATETAEGEDA
jgi:Fe2+ transport system protein FeoA